jgi:hypothetical protein
VKITFSIEGGSQLTAAGSAFLSAGTVFSVGHTGGLAAATSLWLAATTVYGHLVAFMAGSRA